MLENKLMNRRGFVKLSATAACFMPLAGLAANQQKQYQVPTIKPSWLIELIKINDQALKGMAKYKVVDPNHKYVGAYMGDTEIPNPHSTCSFVNQSSAALYCPESEFYQSKDMLKEMQQALKALLKLQHEDGTIDLVDTNFHSTPDTAFMVKRMAQSYQFLKNSGTIGFEPVLALMETFLKNAGKALLVGGIHTPNHRWVVSAALTKLNELFPNPKYLQRIDQWLAEHIDLDPDGQYTEKSTYGYSGVIDRVLITMAKGLNKPELYEAVRKNLKMMRYYLHPNGEVVTEASNRQDKGQIGNMENYYYPLRYMALKDNDGEFAAMCRIIEASKIQSLYGSFSYLLEDSNLWKELPASQPLPTSYVKAFPYSGVVRFRRGPWDATLLSNNPGWFTFHKGNAVLQAMRVATSFFGKGQFQSAEIVQQGAQWVMNKKLEGPYYQPFEKQFISPDGDLGKMPKSNRKQSEVQQLEYTIQFSETNGGMQIAIEAKGTDGVPLTLELVFRKGGYFAGVEALANHPNAYLCKEAEATYSVGTDTIHFGPGKLEHKNTQLRGALPMIDAPTVYITGFTPFKHTLFIR